MSAPLPPRPAPINQPPASTAAERDATKRRRRWLFRIVALLFPVLMLVGAELSYRASGAGYPTSFVVPLAGRPGWLGDNYRFAWRFFPRPLARAPQPLAVKRTPEPGVKRVLVFGASAAMGDPEPAYGLTRVLQTLLHSRYPDQQFEVINCAVTAINSHVVLQIARDCRQLQADAWVVYLGNNEVHGPFGAGTVFGAQNRPLWLTRLGLAAQRTSLGQAAFAWKQPADTPGQWGGMAMFQDHQIRWDADELQSIYANFGQNLNDIISAAGNTPLVVSTVASNLRDSPPFQSQHRADLPAAELQTWQAAYDQGVQAQQQRDWPEAAAHYRTAAAIDADFAELNFRLAECLSQLHQPDEALEQYVLAREHDALRFRADRQINQTIREVCQLRDVRLVDAERGFADLSAGKAPGRRWFFEHVHFTFAGNYQLGKMIAAQLAPALGLPNSEADWPTEDETGAELGLTAFHRLRTLREMQGRLNSPPFTEQRNHTIRLTQLREEAALLGGRMTPAAAQQAVQRLAVLIEQRPDDHVLRYQFAILLDSMGDLEAARVQLERNTQLLPHHAQSHFRLGALLNRLKQRTEAEASLRRALECRPDFARAANSLGICLSHQKRYQESFAQFADAVRWRPSFAEAYYNWSLVLANQGDEDQAGEKLQQAIDADANFVPARLKRGQQHIAAGELAAAVPDYRAVATARPRDVAAQLNLGLLLARLPGQREAAVKQLKKVESLSPGHPQVSAALQHLMQ